MLDLLHKLKRYYENVKEMMLSRLIAMVRDRYLQNGCCRKYFGYVKRNQRCGKRHIQYVNIKITSITN
jgi:hypothetical protein